MAAAQNFGRKKLFDIESSRLLGLIIVEGTLLLAFIGWLVVELIKNVIRKQTR